MTIENCKRLAAHCREMGDEAGANMYEAKMQEDVCDSTGQPIGKRPGYKEPKTSKK